jgi:pyruvate/2-oxoglutarate dehydrogenase complex dihydrolipoamide acyltransferase (E2) component
MSSPIVPPERSGRIAVVLPELGWPEARVSVWFAEPGDRIYAGDRLVEVVGAGASFDVPAPATGRLGTRLVFATDVVRPGQLLGDVVADPE